ncbi:TetR/AcrR family transcriptional regulator [Dyella sp.]|jgi:AcrR family transcriptional regulator|uniref:TetR/AcrR family transcriptional regulator n=1 Tax=Dyella sp. TaxID=1869338 RepID=UPI002D764B45|nr:TetR/AcrR family transcriptional regulator [Dyella sp.]HET6433519.1 TetR/AcrR family transcriptional regulator [Dyella sp.]
MRTSGGTQAADTRHRLLEAAELLFIEGGYDALSLRALTARAGANLAAVNYHFGSKEAMLKELLAQRLDRLNEERLRLLDACESHGTVPDCVTILGVLFVPALQLGRDPSAGPAFLRLLGRVYSDASPFIRDHLQRHYHPIFDRFFEAFARALPHLPRNELGLRLHFALKSLSGVLAADDLGELVAELSMGQDINDAELLARLVALVSPALTAPLGTPQQIAVIDRLLRQAADDAARTIPSSRSTGTNCTLPA